MASHQYPVNLELAGRRCLLVGGGNVAVRKLDGLLASGAAVTVVAPSIDPRIEARAAELQHSAHPLVLVRRQYWKHDLDGVRLVITCTDNAAVNRRVFLDAEAANVWSNSADDPVNCAFTLPSVARQGDLQLTASTRGRSPALSMWLRRRFEAEFDTRWADLLDLLADVREEARATFGTSEVSGWIEALDGGVASLVLAGEIDAAGTRLRESIGLTRASAFDADGAEPTAERPPVGAFESITAVGGVGRRDSRLVVAP